MAWTAHKDEEHMKEVVDDERVIEEHATRIADLIRDSKHFVAFTGAGISTSAGIPDFRGPQGVWTLRAQGKAPPAGVSTLKASPTPSHMALVALEKAGYLKFLISQNTDGLHRRSGFPTKKLAELHGNTNLETCEKCGKEYFRDFSCRARSNDVHDHVTGRKCSCGGRLKDSIINFSESLPDKPLREGFENANNADVMLVLGSSLTVTPAADMPRRSAQRGGKLIICNLQKTPLDELAAVRSHARIDDLMTRVAAKLGIQIPEWRLQRHVRIHLRRAASSKSNMDDWFIEVIGVEPDGTPASVFSGVEIRILAVQISERLGQEPFRCQFSAPSSSRLLSGTIVMNFMSHYNEPLLALPVEFDLVARNESQLSYRLLYNPRTGQWETEQCSEHV